MWCCLPPLLCPLGVVQVHVMLTKAEGGAWWKALYEGGEERSYHELLQEAVHAGGGGAGWGRVWVAGWQAGWFSCAPAPRSWPAGCNHVSSRAGRRRWKHYLVLSVLGTLACHLPLPHTLQMSRCSPMTSWMSQPRA
jgi:hypothetical protein